MGKKGLSRDEKLQRLQELLHDTKTAMTLKELEQRCYKEKGIVANTVKDIAAELQADGLIMCEKIGSSNYYWSFPSQALLVRRQKTEVLEEEVNKLKRRRDELQDVQQALEDERVEGDDNERTTKLQKLATLREEEGAVDAEVGALSANDPALIAAVEKDIKEAKTSAERWTDNLYTIKGIFKEKTGCTEEQFDGNFDTAKMTYDFE